MNTHKVLFKFENLLQNLQGGQVEIEIENNLIGTSYQPLHAELCSLQPSSSSSSANCYRHTCYEDCSVAVGAETDTAAAVVGTEKVEIELGPWLCVVASSC